ncbi:MAG TPA: thiamine-phosphate kinase [Xanthobacteraceae bacterium]|nr:thiamine-phosphate kinase [Xanthobacteraceae bacterium]
MDAGSAEDRLIARYFKPLAKHPAAFGLDDDAAAIAPPAGCDLVLKTDGLIEGVHFFPDDPADAVGRKALRVNLSDLAAKGATPLGFLLAIALPKGFSPDWLAAFARGLGDDAETYACPLLGGDTDSTPGPISISISAFGTLPHGTMVKRAGASAGDRLLVTGTIGDAALGLRVRKEEGKSVARSWRLSAAMSDHLVSRLRLPQPRCALAEAVRQHASAAMDVSDGLVADLAKLCRASNVSADIEVARVPLSAAASSALAADPTLIDTVLTGGEDYEVLCAIPEAHVGNFAAAAARAAVPVTEIGRIMAAAAWPRFLNAQGRPMAFARPGYSHF